MVLSCLSSTFAALVASNALGSRPEALCMCVQIQCKGPKQSVHVTIYYWEHDQAEERPLEEFFRGTSNSLIQWQPQMPLAGSPSVPGMPLQGNRGAGYVGVAMQGMPIQPVGNMPGVGGLFGPAHGQHAHFGDVRQPVAQPVRQQPGAMLNGVRALACLFLLVCAWLQFLPHGGAHELVSVSFWAWVSLQDEVMYLTCPGGESLVRLDRHTTHAEA